MTTQPQILLYNFKEEERTREILRYLSRNGILVRKVQPADYLHPLGYLFGLPGFRPNPEFNLGGNFHEEMLVLKDFSEENLESFLHFFRANGLASVSLKAVLTPVTCHWSSLALYEELTKEREAIKAARKKN